MSKSALIFGASGVTGWAFVNEILNDYPTKGIWDCAHALTNRPLTLEDSLWPKDTRLDLVSGIDLLKGTQEELEAEISDKVKNVHQVTHVYYFAYKASSDVKKELEDAVSMLRRSITAIDVLCPKLEFVVLQTGAKMYGCHLLENHPKDYMPVPLRENYPRLKAPYSEQLFYYPQLDWLSAFAASKTWNWIDTRPDIIVGFVPNQNAYSLATAFGIYLSLFRTLNGESAPCPFPGTLQSWVAKNNDASADMIARQTLHLSLNLPISRKGEGFNVASSKKWQTWKDKWPIICSWFRLIGNPPPDEGDAPEVRRFIKEHLDLWKKLEAGHGLKSGVADSDLTYKGFEYFLLTQFDFDRQYDMSKVYATGFEKEMDTEQTWCGAFERMRQARIIP